MISPFGVLSKKKQVKFCLIYHLSYPKGNSMNDGIDPQDCAVTYTSIDAAISWRRKYSRGSLMAKLNIEAAFHVLPVHPESFYLWGCK